MCSSVYDVAADLPRSAQALAAHASLQLAAFADGADVYLATLPPGERWAPEVLQPIVPNLHAHVPTDRVDCIRFLAFSQASSDAEGAYLSALSNEGCFIFAVHQVRLHAPRSGQDTGVGSSDCAHTHATQVRYECACALASKSPQQWQRAAWHSSLPVLALLSEVCVLFPRR
jgi:hypothetical protein